MLVWSLREAMLRDELVDPGASATSPNPRGQPEAFAGGWHASSFDLSHGAEIIDDASALSNGLFAQWFAPQMDTAEAMDDGQPRSSPPTQR